MKPDDWLKMPSASIPFLLPHTSSLTMDISDIEVVQFLGSGGYARHEPCGNDVPNRVLLNSYSFTPSLLQRLPVSAQGPRRSAWSVDVSSLLTQAHR